MIGHIFMHHIDCLRDSASGHIHRGFLGLEDYDECDAYGGSRWKRRMCIIAASQEVRVKHEAWDTDLVDRGVGRTSIEMLQKATTIYRSPQ